MAWTHRYVTPTGAGDNSGDTADFSDAMTLAQAIADAATPHVGYCYNLKAGTYTPGDVLAFATAGATTTPNWWRGCHTTAGDLDDGTHARDAAGSEGTNMPLFDLSDDAAHQMTVAGAFQIFSNIAVKSVCTTSGGAIAVSGNNVRFYYCRSVNTANNSNSRALNMNANGCAAIGCRLQAFSGASAAPVLGASGLIHGCHIIGGASSIARNTDYTLSHSVLELFATSGIVNAGTSVEIYVNNCTIYSSAATNGILLSSIPGSGSFFTVVNCIIGGAHNGINNSSGGDTFNVFLIRNHFYNCTHDTVGLTECTFDSVVPDLGTLYRLVDSDTDPFLDKEGTGAADSSDFTLVASNTVARGRAFPGTLEGQSVMVGYGDIGAIQHGGPANNKVATDDYDVMGAAGTASGGGTAMSRVRVGH